MLTLFATVFIAIWEYLLGYIKDNFEKMKVTRRTLDGCGRVFVCKVNPVFPNLIAKGYKQL